jgi:hypothetical protein
MAMHNSQVGSLGVTRPFAPVNSNFQNALAMPANSTSQHQSPRIAPAILTCRQSPHKPTSSQPHARQGGCTKRLLKRHSDSSFSRPLNFETSRCITPPNNQAMRASFTGGASLALVYERQMPSFRCIFVSQHVLPWHNRKGNERPRYSTNNNLLALLCR